MSIFGIFNFFTATGKKLRGMESINSKAEKILDEAQQCERNGEWAKARKLYQDAGDLIDSSKTIQNSITH